MNAMEKFLLNNKHKFGTPDDLPGEFHRQALYDQIKPQARVGIITPHGSKLLGKVVMRGPAGWVLNMGGRHGTPGIASPENVIYVSGAKIK